jgi:hemoglobin-like flavoprotein
MQILHYRSWECSYTRNRNAFTLGIHHDKELTDKYAPVLSFSKKKLTAIFNKVDRQHEQQVKALNRIIISSSANISSIVGECNYAVQIIQACNYDTTNPEQTGRMAPF